MNIAFIGDAHGEWPMLKHKTDRYKDIPIVHVGDLGIGFGEMKRNFPPNFKFIHGNHDNADKCASRYPEHFLGRFGFNKDLNLFYVSGAWSIDQWNRVEGFSWWSTEELTMAECMRVLELWEEIKPDYVVTHECPTSIFRIHSPNMTLFPTRTGQLLEQLWQYHKPKLWVFGHHHLSFDKTVLGTRFVCLNIHEDKVFDIPPYESRGQTSSE